MENVLTIQSKLKQLESLGIEGKAQISPLLVDSLAPKLRESNHELWEQQIEKEDLELKPHEKVAAFARHLNFIQTCNLRMESSKSLLKSTDEINLTEKLPITNQKLHKNQILIILNVLCVQNNMSYTNVQL